MILYKYSQQSDFFIFILKIKRIKIKYKKTTDIISMKNKKIFKIQEEIKNCLIKGMVCTSNQKRTIFMVDILKKAFNKSQKKNQDFLKSLNNKLTRNFYKKFKDNIHSLCFKSLNRRRTMNINKISFKQNYFQKKNLTFFEIFKKNLKRIFFSNFTKSILIKNFLEKLCNETKKGIFKYFKNKFLKKLIFFKNYFKLKSVYLFSKNVNMEFLGLLILKKLNFIKKSGKKLSILFLELSYFLQKKKNLKTRSFFINNLFGEKETNINDLFFNYTMSYFLKFHKKECSKKCLNLITISKKDYEKKHRLKKFFFPHHLEDYFLFNFIKFKKKIKNPLTKNDNCRVFSTKNSINFLADLIFLKKKEIFSLIKEKKNKKIIQLFIKSTEYFLRRASIKLEKENFKLISIIFFLILLSDNLPCKKYFSIFLDLLRNRILFLTINLDFNIKKKKKLFCFDFFSYLVNFPILRIFHFSFTKKNSKFFCKVCRTLNLVNFLNSNIFLKKNRIYETLICKNISKKLEFLSIPKKFISIFFFDLMKIKFRKKSKISLLVGNFKQKKISFRKISKQKISFNLLENNLLLEFIKYLNKSPNRFLFFVYLAIQKFMKRLSYQKKNFNLRINKNSSNFIFFYRHLIFLRNFLSELFFKKIIINKSIIIGLTRYENEFLMVIGPNRDFSGFNSKIFGGINRDDKIPRDSNPQSKFIINLDHFSRKGKFFLLNYYIYKNNTRIKKKKLILNEKILKSKDKKIIRSFFFFKFLFKNLKFSKNFPIKEFFLRQVTNNSETFYKFTYNLIKKFSKTLQKQSIDEKNLFDLFYKFDLPLLRDNCSILFPSKKIEGLIKIICCINFSKNLTLNYFSNIFICTIVNKKSIQKLFFNLQFFALFNSYFTRKNSGETFQKSSLDILKVTEKKLKENFSNSNNKNSSFFHLNLVGRFLWIVKKKICIYKKISQNSREYPLKIKKELLCDFSENLFRNTKKALRKLV